MDLKRYLGLTDNIFIITSCNHNGRSLMSKSPDIILSALWSEVKFKSAIGSSPWLIIKPHSSFGAWDTDHVCFRDFTVFSFDDDTALVLFLC